VCGGGGGNIDRGDGKSKPHYTMPAKGDVLQPPITLWVIGEQC
jgi:hypothetical protein